MDSEVGKWCLFTVELELEDEESTSDGNEQDVEIPEIEEPTKEAENSVLPLSSASLKFEQSSDLVSAHSGSNRGSRETTEEAK